MKRMKVLGIAMLAIFAISAIAASAAQAGEFHSEIEKTFLFGEQEGENTFKTTAGNVKCKEATFDSLNAQVGALVKAGDFKTNTVIVQPQYSKCTAFGAAATVDNPPSQTGSACDYHFTATPAGANVKVSGTPVPATGTASCEIKVTVPSGNCSVIVNNQEPGTPTVTFTNVMFEGKPSVKVTSAVSGITTNVEGAKGSICGEPEVMNTGEYIGNVVIRGYKAAAHVAANQVGIKYE